MEYHGYIDNEIGPPLEELEELLRPRHIILHQESGELSFEKLNGFHFYCAASYKTLTNQSLNTLFKYLANGGKAVFSFCLRSEEDAEIKNTVYRSPIGATLHFNSTSPYIFPLSKPLILKTIEEVSRKTLTATELRLGAKYLEVSDSEVEWFPLRMQPMQVGSGNIYSDEPQAMQVVLGDQDRQDGFESFDTFSRRTKIILKKKMSLNTEELVQKDFLSFVDVPYADENLLSSESRMDLQKILLNFEQEYVCGILHDNIVSLTGRPLEEEYARENLFFLETLFKYSSIGTVTKARTSKISENKPQTIESTETKRASTPFLTEPEPPWEPPE